jgi:hypothetical protein
MSPADHSVMAIGLAGVDGRSSCSNRHHMDGLSAVETAGDCRPGAAQRKAGMETAQTWPGSDQAYLALQDSISSQEKDWHQLGALKLEVFLLVSLQRFYARG